MTKLTDTQLMLLSTAARRENGSLIPFPENLAAPADKVRKAITSMIKSGLVEEGEVQDADLAWRTEGETKHGACITDSGRADIGLGETTGTVLTPPPADVPPPAPAKQTKASLVLDMLRREQGATLEELIKATAGFRTRPAPRSLACARRAIRSRRQNGTRRPAIRSSPPLDHGTQRSNPSAGDPVASRTS